MREAPIEQAFREEVEAAGGIAYKFVSPGRRGAPDRIVLLPINDAGHREIVARYFRFVETKATDGHVEDHQEREHKRLRALGYVVEVVNRK